MVADGRIDGFSIGNDLEIERTVQDIPTGITIETAWFTVKRKHSDAALDTLIEKEITTTTSADGIIGDAGSDGEGTITFYLTPADTALLTPLSEYPYSITIQTSNDKVSTPEIGVIVAYPSNRHEAV